MAIRATDDEALANELWGDDKEWDDERQQYVPTEKGGDRPSRGNSSQSSQTSTEKRSDENEKSHQPTAPTTVSPSKSATGSSTAASTGGSGKANPADKKQ